MVQSLEAMPGLEDDFRVRSNCRIFQANKLNGKFLSKYTLITYLVLAKKRSKQIFMKKGGLQSLMVKQERPWQNEIHRLTILTDAKDFKSIEPQNSLSVALSVLVLMLLPHEMKCNCYLPSTSIVTRGSSRSLYIVTTCVSCNECQMKV